MTLIIEVQEATKEWAEEAHSLFLEHNEEMGDYVDIPLDIDYERYLSLGEAGKLLILTARFNEELVGYIVYVITSSPQYKSSMHAYQDTLFVKKDKRKSLLGCGFILLKHSEKILKEMGVQVVHQHVELKHDFSRFLEKLDYKHTGKMYQKRLF